MSTGSKCSFGNPLQQFSQNQRHCFKMELNCACGMYKRKQRSELDSWIFKVHDHVCDMQYDSAYL